MLLFSVGERKLMKHFVVCCSSDLLAAWARCILSICGEFFLRLSAH
jgi:hypothetical protein